jgi:hypothetical protein
LRQEFELDPFFQGFVDLPLVGWHFSPSPAIDDGHIAGTQTPRSARGVNGCVSTPDNNYAIAQEYLFAQGDLPEKRHAMKYTLGLILTRNLQLLGLVGPNRQKDGGKALVEQRIDIPDRMIQSQIDAELQDLVDLVVQYGVGQTVRRDPHSRHPSGYWKSLEHSDLVAHPRQKMGCCQTGGTGANDCHPPFAFGREFAGGLRVGPEFAVFFRAA